MKLRTNKIIIHAENPFEELAEAIVKQAVSDYMNAKKSNNLRAIKEIEDFMKSDYFDLLINLDGDILIRELRRKFGELKGLSEQSNIA